MNPRAWGLLWGILVCVSAYGESPDDFAYRMPLAVADDHAFVRIDVPPAVYEGAVRADLGDLRVFNAAGAALAHAFLPLPASTRESLGSVAVPAFPLRVDAGRADLADVAISVRRDVQGTSVRLATRDGQPLAGERLAGYLIDASDVKQPLVAVTLPFASATNVSARVRIDASDDLVSWRTLIADAPLIDLEFAGRRLVHNRIELARTTAKFLRMTWLGEQPSVDLAGVSAEFGERLVEAPRQWRAVAGAAVTAKPGEYDFDIGGRFPVDRVTLELPEVNTVAPAQLFARATPSDEWQQVASAVFYRLRQTGAEVTNAPVAVGSAPYRYWRVRVDPKAGSPGNDVRLNIGWHPHVLVFAARGNGPYLLAYGSRRVFPAALAIETLVPGYERATFDSTTLAVATPGPPSASSDRSALREPIDIKRWALWSALVLAAIVLGWMALRLTRQIGERAKSGDERSE